jgi:TRAP-type C4-dicarboxylate transport system permease small subunit
LDAGWRGLDPTSAGKSAGLSVIPGVLGKRFLSFITFSDRLSKFLMVVAAAWAFGLSFLVLGNIIGRNVFDAPIDGTAEIVAASIVIIVFLQVGYAIRSRSMLRADFLVIHLPDAVQRVLLGFGYLLGAGFFLMIITGGWAESVLSYVEGEFEGEGALRVPSWPARWTVLLGSALALVNYIVMAYIDVFRPKMLDPELDANSASL